MRPAIDFDRETPIEAHEIQHEFANGVLAAKLVSARTFTQLAPDQYLGKVT